MTDDPKMTIAQILGLPEIPANDDGTTDWPAFAQQMLDLNKPCEAVIYHGPGHQSRTKCERKGPHTDHYAVLYGEHEGDYGWTSDIASADWGGRAREVVQCPNCGVLRSVPVEGLCRGSKCVRERES